MTSNDYTAMAQRRSCKITSFAKVNLYLDILRRRPDGYHDLLSLMAKIDIHDELQFRRLDEPRFTLHCPAQPDLEREDNLILRAARQLTPVGQGVEVVLHKNIPVGGGLGGGSANAAAAI